MGSGPARELEGPDGPLPELDPALSVQMEAALKRFDAIDEQFKSARDDERMGLLVKAWNGSVRQFDDDLRTIGKVMHVSHQLSLDTGSAGGGLTATPYVEETQHKFPKLQFKLNPDSGEVHAVANGHEFRKAPVAECDYKWLERAVVEWVLHSVALRA